MSASEAQSVVSARELAAKILAEVETRRAFADQLLDRELRRRPLPDRDRALLTEMIYGTLRWRGRLDGVLATAVRKPLAEADPLLRNLLRLTVYQLLFLDRIPDYAAVNEAVTIARARAGGRAAGFVNAVLRRILRNDHHRLPEPGPDGPAVALAHYWSHPEWLVKRWSECWGTVETIALLKANNAPPPLCLRINSRRTDLESFTALLRREGIETSPAPWSAHGVYVENRVPVERIPGFAEGLFVVQGEASQLVAHLLQSRPGETVLDACAAPGGKTTHLAELMGDQGIVIATDISPRGIERIEENARRLGLSSIRTARSDMTRELAADLPRCYDRILVDAPCTGLGTLRAHPEIKWNRTEEDVARLAALQRAILNRSAEYLKAGGVLIYSTCTLTCEENEKTVTIFLESHPDFTLEEVESYLPPRARGLVHGPYFLALPHRHGTDGFFAARMTKS